MKSAGNNFQKMGETLANEAKKTSTNYIVSKIREFEKSFLQISWIFFVLGLVVFSFLSIIVLFIAKVVTAGESAITYNAVFIGILVSFLIGAVLGLIWKVVEYNKIKSKFDSMVEKIEEFEI